MRKRNRFLRPVLALLMTVNLLLGRPVPAFASDTTITSVTIRVSSELEPGETLPEINYTNESGSIDVSDGDICVSCSSSKYEITDAEWVTSESKEMDVGDTPSMKVTLSPADGYRFKGSYTSSNVSVRNGTFVSASKKSGDLVVRLRTEEIEGQFSEPDSAYWKSGTDGTAAWEEPDEGGTGRYEVQLRRGGSKVTTIETSLNYHNFYPYMTKEGTYTFRVRTIAKTDNEKEYGESSEWVESDELYIDEDDVSDGSGITAEVVSVIPSAAQSSSGTGSEAGWIYTDGSWYYYYPDGTFVQSGWALVNGSWYLFQSDGKMVTGWQSINGQTYYLDDSGAMQIGWLYWQDSWYYLNPTEDAYNGALVCSNWVVDGSSRYYMTESGAMATGWYQVDGNWYYFYPESGEKAVSTWIGSFYVNEDGIWEK